MSWSRIGSAVMTLCLFLVLIILSSTVQTVRAANGLSTPGAFQMVDKHG